MIQGGRFVYHTPDFKHASQKAEMSLWTIIDDEIYMEGDPWYQFNPANHGYYTNWYSILW